MRNEKVDEVAFRSLCLADCGRVAWLGPCGTTGESPTLSHESTCGRRALCGGSRVGCRWSPVRVELDRRGDCSHPSREVCRRRRRPLRDRLLQPTDAGRNLSHFAKIAESVDIPIYFTTYRRAVVDIAVETMARLARSQMSSGEGRDRNLARPTRERAACGTRWRLISGEDITALGYMAHGGHGCISVTRMWAEALRAVSGRMPRR